jgi:hypothetical protein
MRRERLAQGVLLESIVGFEVDERRPVFIPPTTTAGVTKGGVAPEMKAAQVALRPGEADEVVMYERSALWDEIHTAAEVYRRPGPACWVTRTEEARACVDAANRIDAEISDLQTATRAIADRQRILTTAKATLEKRALPAIRDLVDAARESIALADGAASPEQRSKHLREASVRLQAAETLAQLERIEVSYLAVADFADDHGFPSQGTVAFMAAMNKELQPIVDAAVSLDPNKMQAALDANRGALEHAAEFLPEWAERLEGGWSVSRKAIAALDAAVMVLCVYQGVRAVGEGIARGVGGSGIGGMGGGAAIMSSGVVMTADLAESIRKLIQIGALTNVVISSGPQGTGSAGPLATPNPLEMNTPSGTVVPTKGPFKGKEVRYGDPRNKHTQIATYTLQEILNALRNPKKARGGLRVFVDVVQTGGRAAKDFGSQLSREGVTRYEALVRCALENGIHKGGKFYYKADIEIGFDAEKGRSTSYYRVDGAPNGAHVIPEHWPKR